MLSTGVPALLFLVLAMLFGTTPPVAFTIFVFGLIVTALGFIAGITAAGIFAYRHSNWTKEMREKIAADGIKAEEIEWFRHELKPNEKHRYSRNNTVGPAAWRTLFAKRLRRG